MVCWKHEVIKRERSDSVNHHSSRPKHCPGSKLFPLRSRLFALLLTLLSKHFPLEFLAEPCDRAALCFFFYRVHVIPERDSSVAFFFKIGIDSEAQTDVRQPGGTAETAP